MDIGTVSKNTSVNIAILIVLFLVSGVAAAEVSDIDVTMAVENRIRKDPGTNLNDLDVETSQGIVTITGTVTNILAKERAVGHRCGFRVGAERLKIL